MDMYRTIGIAVAALISFLMVVVEHYLPWRAILKQELPRIPSYIMGVLAILIPLTMLFFVFAFWSSAEVLIAFWVVTGSAGAGTILSYNLDSLIHIRMRAEESEE